MAKYSRQIQKFLTEVGVDQKKQITIVPKSDSCASPGDFLFFRYVLGVGKGSREERLLLVTEPVTRDARTGNLLLTGFKVPENGDYTPDSMENLYNKKELPEDNYRTYIMGRIYGTLKRISKKAPDSNLPPTA